MFKEKTSKKRIVSKSNSKDISTLDVMHNNMIKVFSSKSEEKNNHEEYLMSLTNTQTMLKTMIEDLFKTGSIQDNEKYNFLWSSNISISEEIIRINSLIKENVSKYNEVDYYNNTSDILFNYYELLEKQSNVNKGKKIRPSSKVSIKQPERTILDALNNIHNEKQESNKIESIYNTNTEKTDLVEEYLLVTNKNHVRKVDITETELCTVCQTPLVCLQYDAIMICESCGYQELLLVEQNRPLLKQHSKDTSHFSYKRINHFREWCNQVQGKESTDIPNDVFEKILNEIKKEKITDNKNITYSKMREILKRLRINKYYEHINYIINRINGVPTPQFSPELEEKLFNMFRDIQGPFLKHCPKDRKNFLSYSYVLYKFFQILGLNEYLKYFPLLKSREKLYVQDQIWKNICMELNYEFLQSPSL